MTPDSDSDALGRDPLGRYAAGDRDAVHDARPDEPTEADWDEVRRRIHDRLNLERETPARRHGRWHAAVWVSAGAALTAVAAMVAWVAFAPAPPEKLEGAEGREGPSARVAPVALFDPLAEFPVLPMAGADDVDLQRVPGAGWFPVGSDPLPGTLALATTDEVELDDPNPAWSQVTPSPGDAPVIFATKPR